MSPSNATKNVTQIPYKAANGRSGSSGASPSACACSISSLACSAAALVSGEACPLT